MSLNVLLNIHFIPIFNISVYVPKCPLNIHFIYLNIQYIRMFPKYIRMFPKYSLYFCQRIKGDQIQKQLKEEKDVMADQITALNSHIDAQEQMIKKLEERERSLQTTMVRLE